MLVIFNTGCVQKAAETGINANYKDETYCEKDSDCTLRDSCCNSCHKDYVNIYNKDPVPKEDCTIFCTQDCPLPSKFTKPVCDENRCVPS
jgi:hypothetical protein